MIPVSLAWQDGLVVGNCLSRAMVSHDLLLAMPDGFQSLFLLWSQTLITDLNYISCILVLTACSCKGLPIKEALDS